MTPVEMNLNQNCEITLTAYGAMLVNYENMELRRKHNLDFDIQDVKEGETITMTLWQIMQTFGGDKIFMGMREVPFKDNKISFVIR